MLNEKKEKNNILNIFKKDKNEKKEIEYGLFKNDFDFDIEKLDNIEKGLNDLEISINMPSEEIRKKKRNIQNHTGNLNLNILDYLYIPGVQQELLKKVYGDDILFIETLNELEENYDLSDYHLMENNDFKKFQVLKDAKAIIGVNKKTMKKAIGIFQPTISIAEMYMEEYFFISPEIVTHFYNTKNIDFIQDVDEENKLHQLLQYMEHKKTSDLHFFPLNDFYYTFTARINSDVSKITENRIKKSIVNDLIRESIIACGQDVYTKTPEVRGLIKQSLVSEGKKIERNFRVHIIDSSTGNEKGKSVSIRKLMNFDELSKLGLDGLGYGADAQEIIKEAVNTFHNGVSIISGATNSGKSTLLYTILIYLLNKGKRIHTIESPIEMVIPGLIQIDLKDTEQAKEELRMDMTKAMKAMLSQDPDISLINEVRSKEEIMDLMNLALQGHMAFSTIHANDVSSTLTRLYKSASKEDIVNSLRMIVNQELISKKCQICSGVGETINGTCPACEGKKVLGRLPVYEIALYKNIEESDNLQNFEELIKEKKLSYISKIDVIKDYKERDIIMAEDYNRIMKSHAGKGFKKKS
jgi:type II secretory ATPase GspE/PulE/Tfp pilus assembly ATPase PilB-like protein